MNKQNDARRGKPDLESSELSSKEDENLIQNWSLTFTEYMQEANQIPEHVTTADSTTTPRRVSRAMKYPDGRVQDDLYGEEPGPVLTPGLGPPGLRPGQQDRVTTKPVHVHVDTGRLEYKTNDTSDSSDKHTVETHDNDVNGHRLYERTGETTQRSRGHENIWYKEEAREQAALMKQNVQRVQASKHARLPPIDTKQIETRMSLDQNQNQTINETLEKIDQSKTQNDINKCVDKAKHNGMGESGTSTRDGNEKDDMRLDAVKPVVNGDTGGKVQPIYMRFPGQRTGQMVL